MNKHKLKKQVFIEASRSNFFVFYILFPMLTVAFLNGYYVKNLFLTVIYSIVLFLIFHFLLGYRFFKRITLKEDFLRIDYNLLYKYNKKRDIPYDNIKKIELRGGIGVNPTFMKIYTTDSKKYQFLTDDWDEKDIISILNDKTDNLIIDNFR